MVDERLDFLLDSRDRTEVKQVLVWPDDSPDGLAEGHFVHRVLDPSPERGPDVAEEDTAPEEASSTRD
jgi:hypothetical protein